MVGILNVSAQNNPYTCGFQIDTNKILSTDFIKQIPTLFDSVIYTQSSDKKDIDPIILNALQCLGEDGFTIAGNNEVWNCCCVVHHGLSRRKLNTYVYFGSNHFLIYTKGGRVPQRKVIYFKIENNKIIEFYCANLKYPTLDEDAKKELTNPENFIKADELELSAF